MTFSRAEEDDFLLELFLYLERDRTVRKGWTAAPRYRCQNREPCDRIVSVSSDSNAFETRWSMKYNTVAPLYNTVECKRLVAIVMLVTADDRFRLRTTVQYIACCTTFTGFFNIQVNDWMVRCSTTNECVHILNTIASNIIRIITATETYRLCRDTVIHLSHKIETVDDKIHLASIQRKISLMKQDAGKLHRLYF